MPGIKTISILNYSEHILIVNCKTKFHSQILKLEINLSKKHWRLILPKKDYNSYHWFSTCCSGQNRRT